MSHISQNNTYQMFVANTLSFIYFTPLVHHCTLRGCIAERLYKALDLEKSTTMLPAWPVTKAASCSNMFLSFLQHHKSWRWQRLPHGKLVEDVRGQWLIFLNATVCGGDLGLSLWEVYALQVRATQLFFDLCWKTSCRWLNFLDGIMNYGSKL